MVDEHVLRLDVAMHDAQRVRIVKSLEDLVEVILSIAGSQLRQESLVIGLLDVLEDEAVHLTLFDYVQQFDCVVSSSQRHEDLDLSIDLLELDWTKVIGTGFEHLDNARLRIEEVEREEDLAILASAYLLRTDVVAAIAA